ncbi:MAG: hypothetical protein KF745_09230 [Phycisphaeraceae bacterium]|nr:hypothetical protein [Phycisphaeraceae bacterium]
MTIPGTPDPSPALAAVLRAVGAACAVCRQLQATLDLSLPIVKRDGTPVTAADMATQGLLLHLLGPVIGPTPVLAEESSAPLREASAARHLGLALEALEPFWPGVTAGALFEAIDRAGVWAGGAPPRTYWTLDPIDGTRGFLRGQQFAICLAQVHEGRAVLSALGCPNLAPVLGVDANSVDGHGQVFGAVLGEQPAAVVLPADEPEALPRAVRAAVDWPEHRPLVLVTSRNLSEAGLGRIERVIAAMGRPARLVRIDSQCKYAVVARGEADGFLRIPGHPDTRYHVWDHAPGAALATAAGCITTDVRGRELDLTTGAMLTANLGIVSAAPWLHGDLVRAIERAGVAPG